MIDIKHFLNEIHRLLSDSGESWITFQHLIDDYHPTRHQGMKAYTINQV